VLGLWLWRGRIRSDDGVSASTSPRPAGRQLRSASYTSCKDYGYQTMQVVLPHSLFVPLSCQVGPSDTIDLQEPMQASVALVEISHNPMRLVPSVNRLPNSLACFVRYRLGCFILRKSASSGDERRILGFQGKQGPGVRLIIDISPSPVRPRERVDATFLILVNRGPHLFPPPSTPFIISLSLCRSLVSIGNSITTNQLERHVL